MDIKSIVSNVATKVDSIARTAVKKGGVAANSAKLALSMRSERKKLDGMFSTLGKLFYEQVNGTDVRAQIKAQVMEIEEQKLVIAELKTAMEEAGGKAKCKKCGKLIDIDAAYCPSCGCSQGCEKSAGAAEDEIVVKPLTADEFVEFFKGTTAKYFVK